MKKMQLPLLSVPVLLLILLPRLATGMDARELTRLAVEARMLRFYHVADPWRPGYHITPAEGRLVPYPAAKAVFRDGRVHLNYAVTLDGVVTLNHLSGIDLMHWRQHPSKLVDAPSAPSAAGAPAEPIGVVDGQGRRIEWHWVADPRDNPSAGSLGPGMSLSLPRLIEAGGGGLPRVRPLPELERLRHNPRDLQNVVVPAKSGQAVPKISGDSLELHVELRPPADGRCGVKVLCSPDGAEHLAIVYDAAAGRLSVENAPAGKDQPAPVSTALKLAGGEALSLRIFVDRSIVEVFANERQVLVARAYPTQPDRTGVMLFSEGSECNVTVLRAWDIMPCNAW